MDTVDEVVRGHESPGVGLSNGNFKGAEIDFSQRSFLDKRVDGETMCLLFIAGEI